MAELVSLSTTDNSNTGSVFGMIEGIAPSAVNDRYRGLCGAIARHTRDTDGYLTSAGTANAQTLTISSATTAAAAGEAITFRAGATNTGATTINITPTGGSARGAVAIQMRGQALTGGEIVVNMYYTIYFDGTVWQLVDADNGVGTISLPGIAFGQDTDTGLYRSAANEVSLALGAARTALFTASGVTLFQAGNDTAILSRDSSDVSHGRTTLAATTVYGWDQKIDAAAGGLQINGISDAPADYGLRLVGYADSPTGAHTTAAVGIVEVYAATVSGTDVANLAVDANVFVVKGRLAGAWTAEFIIDAEGELFARTGGASPTDFDTYDDTVLVRAFNDFLGMDRDNPDFDRMNRLADMKFMGRVAPEQWDTGERPLWCVTRVVQLHNGWMCQAVERERIRDEIIEEMLPGFLAKVAERAIGQNVGGIPALEK